MAQSSMKGFKKKSKKMKVGSLEFSHIVEADEANEDDRIEQINKNEQNQIIETEGPHRPKEDRESFAMPRRKNVIINNSITTLQRVKKREINTTRNLEQQNYIGRDGVDGTGQ